MQTAVIVVFDDVEELDFIGPYEVLSYANKVRPGSLQVCLASAGGGMVRAFNGLNFAAHCSFAQCPPADMLVVPGGKGRLVAMRDPAVLDFVRRQAQHAQWVASVCTGAFILAEAGLLRGKTATTHHTALEELAGYADITVTPRKVVRDGNVLCGAGVSSGLDLALELLRCAFDDALADKAAQGIEYAPAGRP